MAIAPNFSEIIIWKLINTKGLYDAQGSFFFLQSTPRLFFYTVFYLSQHVLKEKIYVIKMHGVHAVF